MHRVNDYIVAMTMWLPHLDGRTGPRYRAIADSLAEDIAKGRLAAGSRLPTHRWLADRLGVTVGTVTRAYLEAARRTRALTAYAAAVRHARAGIATLAGTFSTVIVFLPLVPCPPLLLWSGSIACTYLFYFPAFGIGPFAATSLVPRALQVLPVLVWVVLRRRHRPVARDASAPEALSLHRGAMR